MSAHAPSANAAYVGFANLPKQFNRRMVKRGFEFTLMLVGESGLGKSTLVSSLFGVSKDYNQNRIDTNAEQKRTQTVEITKNEVHIEESGVKLKITIVDTPGFGESLTGTDQQGPISDFIDSQFQQYLDDETGINRRNITDTRVHCCFYFISPHSNGLRPMDIDFMKQLHHKVNIVPLIAKSDTLTPQEIASKKARILQDIKKEQIRIYQLPDADDDEGDKTYKTQLNLLKKSIPFAVVGSTEVYEVNGKKVKGRLYPWGVVEIENPKHSEFSLLKNMLVSHMQDLHEVTHDLHYENYRALILSQNGGIKPGHGGANIKQEFDQSGHAMTGMPGMPGMPGMGGMIGMNGMAAASSTSMNTDPDSLMAKELEIQRMKEMMEQMQRQLALQQQQVAMHTSMEQMGNPGGHMPGMTNGHSAGAQMSTPGTKHRPPPPPRRVDGSASYSRTNLDV